MTYLKQHDGFDLVRAAISACSLDGRGARAQKQRSRAIAPFITDVRQEAMTVVAGLAPRPGRRCRRCGDRGRVPVLRPAAGLRVRPAHSLRLTATGAAASSALDLIATGFRRRLTR